MFMIVGPAASFLIQISKIKQTNSSEGFSKIVILILLLANILRIFFWVGKRFTVVLLFQSIIMIIIQLYLLYICLIYSNAYKSFRQITKDAKGECKASIYKFSPPHLSKLSEFWQWIHLSDYMYFLVLLIIVVSVFSKMIGYDNIYYVEFLGSLATGIEALIGIPQVIANFLEQSTGSLSIGMILFWLFGDSFKTAYFVINNQPSQFLYCGTFQLITDFIIVFQIIYYNSSAKQEKEKDIDEVSIGNRSYKKVDTKYHHLDGTDHSPSKDTLNVEDDIAVTIV
jgi:solute carrier family 66, member 2